MSRGSVENLAGKQQGEVSHTPGGTNKTQRAGERNSVASFSVLLCPLRPTSAQTGTVNLVHVYNHAELVARGVGEGIRMQIQLCLASNLY